VVNVELSREWRWCHHKITLKRHSDGIIILFYEVISAFQLSVQTLIRARETNYDNLGNFRHVQHVSLSGNETPDLGTRR
jgi:hypothetical protein